MTKARDSSGPFFVPEPQQIRALNELWNCPEFIQLFEEFVTFRYGPRACPVPQASKIVGAISGLTPRRHQWGEIERTAASRNVGMLLRTVCSRQPKPC